MTRKEAKKEFWKEGGVFEEMFEYCFDKILKLPYKGSVVDAFIDKIYDDLESRVCKNCSKYKDGECRIFQGAKFKCTLDILNNKNFGCNKFERRIK